MKLFNLAMPKSGTSTLHKALGAAGLRSAHWRSAPRKQIKHPAGAFVGWNIYHHYLKGADPLSGLADYDAITQADVIKQHFSLWPQMDQSLLREIRHYHPDCIFLLLTRDPAEVANSMVRWSDLQARLIARGAPGLGPAAARSESGLEAWVCDHYTRTREAFGEDPKFVELALTDPQTPVALARLLSCDMPWWGVANKNDHPNP